MLRRAGVSPFRGLRGERGEEEARKRRKAKGKVKGKRGIMNSKIEVGDREGTGDGRGRRTS